MSTYRWGILGAGRIATLFTEGLHTLADAHVYAIASRALDKARDFASENEVEHAYGSYAAMLADPEVDIVYIATPHAFHYVNARDALLAGKHVLCEKPFTLNAGETRELVDLARHQQRFLMEAMWNRFQPWAAKLKQLIESDMLGDLLHLKADLSFRFEYDVQHRLFNPQLGGGALLDLGVYPISLASMLLGEAEGLCATAHRCETGVDDQVDMLLTYSQGKTASLSCSSRYTSEHRNVLYGSKGHVVIEGMIGRPHRLNVVKQGGGIEIIDTPYASNGYQYEAQAVMDSIGTGKLEHSSMTLAESISIMGIMDKVRQQIGVVYPQEHSAYEN